MFASSIATRLTTTHFSLQGLTNSRRFCLLSKNLKFRSGSLPSVSSEAFIGGALVATAGTPSRSSGYAPACDINVRRRSRVCVVMRPHRRFITVEKAYARELALPGYVSTISGPTGRVGSLVGDCPLLVEVQPNPRIRELFALPHPDASKMFRDRQIRSQPEIGLLDHLVLAHFRRCSGAGDPAVFKDIDVIGELEAVVGVLLDEDDRLPALGQAAKN